MGLRVNQNISALTALYNVQQADASFSKSAERLSSGLRINRGADDPAGLVNSEKFRSQIRGIDQAVNNAKDGINLTQTAEGALNETSSILLKMRDLALHAANETNDADAVAADQQEIKDSITQLDRIASQTSFGNRKLLNGASGVSGSATQADVAFLAGSKKTVSGSYKVNITQAATKAVLESRTALKVAGATGTTADGTSTAGTAALASNAGVKIEGAGLGTAGITLSFTTASTLADVANTINTNTTLADAGVRAKVVALDTAGTVGLQVYSNYLSSGGAATLKVSAVAVDTVGSAADMAALTGIATGGTDSAAVTGGVTNTTELSTDEALTFTNGSASVTVNLKAGTRLGVAVDQINTALNKAGINTQASVDYTNQVFKLSNTEFGSKDTVTNMVTSDQAGGAGTLNLLASKDTAFNIAEAGTLPSGTSGTTGRDVKGTIDGEAATGAGNVLKGDIGNASTEGLTVTYSGTVTGDAGTVTVQNNVLTLQIGAFSGETSTLQIDDLSAQKLGIGAKGVTTLSGKDINVSEIDLTTQAGAQDAVKIIDSAIAQVSGTRSTIGATQANVLESAVRNLGVAKTNMSSTESTIRDLDFAQEILSFSKSQILQQSGFAMVSQTKQAQQMVLSLLQ